jgi:alanyl-tRNA synthetase
MVNSGFTLHTFCVMNSNEIRNKFLHYFVDRNHKVVRSSSLVPAHDPTLLFSNAGMNQFKDVFLGLEKRDYPRACSSQKCVRAGGKHNDLEQVGRTTRHHTFFEMLGNFSFGDYFKAEAIPWAWELVTKDFAIPKEKLYATVFREDDEAEEMWAKIVPRERIFRRDEKDNFWQMGETGPCGPCSEIHYDMGPAASDLGHKDCQFPCPEDCGRYVELWNLVFMQFNRDEEHIMTPLPRPSIDTGAGLERLAAVLQGKISNFDTDLFKPLIKEAAELANKEYGENHETDVSLRIIADHARAATFLISDGVLPSNEKRGSVLRRIMTRASYHCERLGMKEPSLYKISSLVAETMKEAYPELGQNGQHIAKVIKFEEERYERTTRVGVETLDRCTIRLDYSHADQNDPQLKAIKAGLAKASGLESAPPPYDEIPFGAWKDLLGKHHGFPPGGPIAWLPGGELFKLKDTFGLPPDFVADIARSNGLNIDWAGYEAEMQKQRERSRTGWLQSIVERKAAEMQVRPAEAHAPREGRAGWLQSIVERKAALAVYTGIAEDRETEFDGYEQARSENCKVVALIRKGGAITEAKQDNEVEIVLDHTPFYAESGGQVGDVGHLLAPDSSSEVAHVTDTYRPVSGVIAHKAIAKETLRAGDVVTAVVDAERRDAIRRNHTATHLLHAALRNELGTHVKQAGSLVAPDRLRFDFSHYAPLAEQDVLDIEDLVNAHILKNEEVVTTVMDRDAAVDSGAMALFGEKYADQVRVLTIDDFSKELCGGTHVRRTGDIGLFKIISESSVAAGTRRIEAATGAGVLEHLRKADQTLGALARTLRSKPEELVEAAEKLAESDKKLRKQLEAQQMKRAASAAGDLAGEAREVKGVRVVASRVEVTDRAAMRQMVDSLRPKLGSGVIVLGSVADGKVALIVGVTQDLTAKLDAGKIVREAAKLIEGSGGGRKDLAEAGGKNPEKLDESLAAVPGIIEKML